MRAKFIYDNLQQPFSNKDKNKVITGKYPLENINYIGDAAYDNKKKKRKRKRKINEGIISTILTIGSIFYLCNLIKKLLESPEIKKRKKDEQMLHILYKYFKDCYKKGQTLKYVDNYFYHTIIGKNITLNIYKNNSVEWFPEIVTYCKNKETNFIQFEWIEGCVIDYKNIKRAFYDLGKFHNKNKVSNKKYGFITLC